MSEFDPPDPDAFEDYVPPDPKDLEGAAESSDLAEGEPADIAASETLVPIGDVLNEITRLKKDAATETAKGLMPTGRTPPNVLDAERAILGGLLLDPAAIEKVIDEGLRADDFYRRAHGIVYQSIYDLHNAAEPVDTLTVTDALLKSGDLDTVGGAAFISQLEALIPTAAHVGVYARLIREKATLRTLIHTATEVVSSAYEQNKKVTDIVDEAERAILAISEQNTRRGIMGMKELVQRATEQLEKAYNEKRAITGIPSGFADIDQMTSGWQGGDLVIIAARPSMGKCLAADAEITLADGSVSTIQEIVERKTAKLLTVDHQLRLAVTEPSHFIDDGIKPTFRVTTRLGRTVTTTIVHPFLTISGWRKLEELQVGDKIGVPRALPVFGSDEMDDAEVKVLGYLLGDGCLTDGSPEFTSANPLLRADYESAVEHFRKLAALLDVDVGQLSPTPISARDPNQLTSWLQQNGVLGCSASTKFVPRVIFRLPKPQVALFLSRLFATDGWAMVLASGQSQLGYTSISERLARQVQHLLLRFGVIAKLRKRKIAHNGERRVAFQLDISDARSIQTFADEIGIFGKEEQVAAVTSAIGRRRYQTNGDLIPVEVWSALAKAKGAGSWASLGRRAGFKDVSNLHVGTRQLSRDRLKAMATALDDEALINLATSDLYWDEIVSIEPLGPQQVYDLTVPKTHNFIADDICVHNTAFTLNVAANAAIRAQQPVAFFSLEMGADQLVQRLLGAEARIDISALRRGFIQSGDWVRLAQAASELGDAPIFIDETPALSVAEMRTKCRRLKHEHDIQMAIIDYLQLMTGPAGYDNKATEVGEISKGLKSLARELNIPVIALSQLNRGVESRTDKRPMMSDLRESGAIEQDADLIGFLFREEYYLKDSTPEDKLGVGEFIIGKHRNGPTGNVELRFFSSFTRFESMERNHEYV